MKMAEQNKWDLTPIFEGDDDPRIVEARKRVEEASYAFINKWKDRDDYLSDPVVLREALDEYEAWARNFGCYDAESYYFGMRGAQDQLDTKLKGRLSQISDLSKKIQNDIQFFDLRLAKVSPEKQAEFLASPLLLDYRHHLEMLFAQARYQLSEPEEKILNLTSQASHGAWVKMLSAFLSREERMALLEDGSTAMRSFPALFSLLKSQNKAVRDAAAVAVHKILAKNSDVAEHELNAVLHNKKVRDELRGLERPDRARHLADDLDSQVVDVLLESVSAHFPIVHRWYELKAKLLGLPRLEYHERVVEYGEISGKYSYQEAVDLVSRVFNRLDAQFGQIFDGFTANGQVDVFPARGKRGGAFCAGGSLVLPTYILLNFTGRLDDVCTMAHETGHGINDELMKLAQDALNFGAPLSTAEVASTFMEDFVLQELMAEADDELRLAIMVKKLDDDVGTIFRQVACYLFEKELHAIFREKGYLGKAEIGSLFQKHMEAYMGPAVEQSAGSENWWVYWSHIRTFFYVYSYASGLLISKSLQAMVHNDHAFVAKVKEFLSAGSSKSPKEIFKELGIDITDPDFWNKGLGETEKLLGETEKLAHKLGKIS
ncbi:hypothetical protein A3A84_03960 [Candidatus Collierbacteria bacterium RIFCSPLOWO2_01_FULL_50_23]|uniref:Oligoendopeptidase F n=2 Tax=Candidatus Collieribacteriota TaxID=1752725 RepID=A0A1F5EWP1_9BACT|nr:MAG: hypothetical protein A3D09_00435 [Candidatus Collierbacteria bacterium RIFCSPHIGHO2_02_FULL_49_10]OGD72176.1 MAG: hypothetical protein A2703_00100 [Candidatus Collierbacteria bacterium RIFCSPHIGHO2_01_FULL_50_25]OGD74964.1 MAG: hypothetical protein A3A84_03960 [Candidatus Collierbacteria bacterium RIFCSPLOWO2_01_FULL_50_23]